MEECCSNCKCFARLKKWDYTKIRSGEEWKQEQEGFACKLFADDVIWMHGLDPDKAQCEMFTRRQDDTDQ